MRVTKKQLEDHIRSQESVINRLRQQLSDERETVRRLIAGEPGTAPWMKLRNAKMAGLEDSPVLTAIDIAVSKLKLRPEKFFEKIES